MYRNLKIIYAGKNTNLPYIDSYEFQVEDKKLIFETPKTNPENESEKYCDWTEQDVINRVNILSGLEIVFQQKGLSLTQSAFTYIKERRKFFNISAIEDQCGITRTSLLNAINRNQKTFGQSGKLILFLNENFIGWNDYLTNGS